MKLLYGTVNLSSGCSYTQSLGFSEVQTPKKSLAYYAQGFTGMLIRNIWNVFCYICILAMGDKNDMVW